MLVFFMQAGFALVETGFTLAKNAAHTMTMNLMVFLVGALGFWFVGFPVMFGNFGAIGTLGGSSILSKGISLGGWNILGNSGWFLSGTAYDVSVVALFFFQMVFMDTAVTADGRGRGQHHADRSGGRVRLHDLSLVAVR